MDKMPFETLVAEEWNRMPEQFKEQVHNVALLTEEEPSAELRIQQGLEGHDTLLGYYHGIPVTERGELYGIGVTLPDTITLFRLPLIEEAAELMQHGRAENDEDALRLAVRETLWHEVGHYFGLGEHAVEKREDEGTNEYRKRPGSLVRKAEDDPGP